MSEWDEIKIRSMIFPCHFKLLGTFHLTGRPISEESWQLTGGETRHKNGTGIDQVEPTWEREMLTINWKVHGPCMVSAAAFSSKHKNVEGVVASHFEPVLPLQILHKTEKEWKVFEKEWL